MSAECILVGIFVFMIGFLLGMALETKATEDAINNPDKYKHLRK